MQSQRRRLQDRIDQEPAHGAKLAATVRRSSGYNAPSSNNNIDSSSYQSQPHASSTSTHEKNDAIEAVGDVVERRRTRTSRRRYNPIDNLRSGPFNSENIMSRPVNGFPSLQQRQIGTFLLSRNVADASSRKSSTMASSLKLANSSSVNTSLSILEQSSKESQALLEQMSIDEIRDSIHELHTVLKPETIRFLKQRGSRPKVSSLEDPKRQHQTVHVSDLPREEVPTESFSIACSIASKDDKKESMATLLSSIQSYKDLDDAYDYYLKCQTSGKTVESPMYSIKDEYDEEERFQLACKLLRSSSPQQTIWAARVVYHRLKNEFERNPSAYSLIPTIYSKSKAKDWPFPVLLPVSLRCLLDAQSSTSSSGNGVVLLTTYVLQSLLLLVQLRACPDHVFFNPSESKRCYHQVDLLDDVVPTAPLSFCYSDSIGAPVNAQKRESTSPNGAPTSACVNDVTPSTGAYWTSSSSSASAMTDGQAFLRDPMWTLLSRMRIIPRIAEILQIFKVGSSSTLPIEARISICGLLAMIGQRSPGAASAIIHHPTLFDDLLDVMIVHQNNSSRYDSRSATPFVYLLCILARQSRVAAEGIHRRIATDSYPVLLHLLAPYSKASDNTASLDIKAGMDDFTLQQWTVILWRILLRYGLGLDILPTIMTLSARHLTLGAIHATESVSLAPDMYSCFAVILDVTAMNTTILKGLKFDSMKTTSVCRMVSLPWQRQTIYHLQKLVGEDNFCFDGEVLRLANGILRFWGALLNSIAKMITTNEATDDIVVTLVADLTILIPILVTALDNVVIASVVSRALSFACNPEFLVGADMDMTSLNAATCAAVFIESFLVLISRIKDFCLHASETMVIEVNDLERMLAEQVRGEIRKRLTESVDLCCLDEKIVETIHRNRFTFNRVHARIVAFLCRGDFSYEMPDLRTMAFSVVGRLNVGEEFTASMLFRIPKLFRSSPTSRNSLESSLISNVLFRELILTQANQIQLDHSCRLHGDRTFVKNSESPVVLQSLLTDAGQGTKPGNKNSVYFLPIGKYWLWKLLSGSSVNPELPGGVPERDETIMVLNTVLKIIDELETGQSFYCANLSSGPKLYYLVNIFLNGKTVLLQDCVSSQIEKLFNLYFYGIAPCDLLQFAEECLLHSEHRDVGHEGKTSASTNDTDVEAILNPQERDSFGYSTNQIRGLETLIDDLCSAYMDFGVHFPLFTKCVRFFLVHGFPTKVRCSIIHRLRSDLHLLTLHDEQESLANLLTRFVAGGLPSFDQSSREDPILIDCVASIYAKGYICRPDDQFMKSWAICILARNLAISVVTKNSSSLLVSKRRVLSLDSAIASQVVLASALWLTKDGSVSSLVSSVLLNDVQRRTEVSEVFSSVNIEVVDWDNSVNMLTAFSQVDEHVSDEN